MYLFVCITGEYTVLNSIVYVYQVPEEKIYMVYGRLPVFKVYSKSK